MVKKVSLLAGRWNWGLDQGCSRPGSMGQGSLWEFRGPCRFLFYKIQIWSNSFLEAIPDSPPTHLWSRTTASMKFLPLPVMSPSGPVALCCTYQLTSLCTPLAWELKVRTVPLAQPSFCCSMVHREAVLPAPGRLPGGTAPAVSHTGHEGMCMAPGP